MINAARRSRGAPGHEGVAERNQSYQKDSPAGEGAAPAYGGRIEKFLRPRELGASGGLPGSPAHLGSTALKSVIRITFPRHLAYIDNRGA